MHYLTNIPDTAKDYGIQKLLITRSLTIDYKHRGTEMFIRNKDLLPKSVDLLELMERRENQLRFIYHISRKALHKRSPNDLCKQQLVAKDINMMSDFSLVYYDFLSLAKDGLQTYNKLNKDNTIVFTTKHSVQEALKFFIKNNIEAPKNLIYLTNEEIYELNKDKIVTLVLSNIVQNELDTKLLWCLNYHIHVTNKLGSHYLSYKTDSTLTKGKIKSKRTNNEKISNNKNNI